MPRSNDTISDVDKFIGVKVNELRIAMGLSREQLARKIDVTHQQLQKYEKGTNRMSPGRLISISNALNKPIEYFFEGIETNITLPEHHQRMCIEISRNFLRIKNPMHQNAVNMLVRTLSENQ